MSKVIDYYRSKGSRWGYKILLRGMRHFGYYPEHKKVTHNQATVLMMEEVLKRLNLTESCNILDAGCGEGQTAIYIAEKSGCRIEGVDLLSESIGFALENKQKSNANVNFNVGDFTKLSFPDESFDGVYALESFTHVPDHNAAIKELKRVLKPGGKLVIFDYETTPLHIITDKKIAKSLKSVSERTSAPGLLIFNHGFFNKLLTSEKFTSIKVDDLTERVFLLLRRFHRIALIPHFVIRLLDKEKRFPNTTAGAIGTKIASKGWWKFVAVSANKSTIKRN